MPYVNKRARVISTYFEKHQGCPVDAIYTLRRKQLGKTDKRWYRYQQIFEDFDIDEEEKLISNCIIIANYNKEIGDKHDLMKEFKSDIQNSFGVDLPHNHSVRNTVQLEGISALTTLGDSSISNKVNPVTFLVPNMKLDSNNCTFQQVAKALESIKHQIHDHTVNHQQHQSGNSFLDTTHTLKTLNKSFGNSIEKHQDNHIHVKGHNNQQKGHSKKNHDNHNHKNINFLEAFFLLNEWKSEGRHQHNSDLKYIAAIEAGEIQSHINRNEQCSDFLRDKHLRKRNAILQKKYKALTDLSEIIPKTSYDEIHPEIWQVWQFQSMLQANETLNSSYIQDYRKRYLNDANVTAEEVMQLPTINECQFYSKIQWNEIPNGNLNYFTTHRFIVLKAFNFNINTQQNPQNNNNFQSNLYEFVDVLKEMGEFVPNDIYQIITNQQLFNVQDWLCKKMFARPMNQLQSKKKPANINN